MAPTLGKRKRITREQLSQSSPSPSPSPSFDSGIHDGEDIRDIFQRAFEAKFKPLEVKPKKSRTARVEEASQDEQNEEEDEERSDWSGITSEDETSCVQVVECNSSQAARDKASKAEMRAFMSSKPPSSTSQLPLQPGKSTKDKDGDPTEATHLKNDLALQRLLRDSHLLSSTSPSVSTSPSRSGTSTPTLTATGSLRHKSTDLHLQQLGAKRSIHAQKSMPMPMRKGIAAKAKLREEKRRREAKENGITLEKEVRIRVEKGKRDKGVGGPSVGRFKGGMLTLSRRDVRDITSGTGGGRGGKGRGRGGRR